MGNVRPVCIYQQYYCCPSHKDCRLYHLCSQLPKKPFVPNSTTYKVFNAVPLDRAEIRKHQEQYRYYNLLWGDLKSKVSDYCKRNHEHKMEYQRQYRAKKNSNKYQFDSVLFEGLCDKNGKIAYFINANPYNLSVSMITSIVYTQMFEQIDESKMKCDELNIRDTSIDIFLDNFQEFIEVPQFIMFLYYFTHFNIKIYFSLQDLSWLKNNYSYWEELLDISTVVKMDNKRKKRKI